MSEVMRTSVAVCTPWQNHLELERDYFHALRNGPYPDEVIIVDNGSDPRLGFARIRNETNLGFARASNQALEAATADICVFLNNDIELITPGWLDTLVAAVAPGVLAGQLRTEPHGNVDGIPFPYLDGWCIAGTREDLLTLGGFDEDLDEPSYYSDNLLSLRARLDGMTLRDVRLGIRHKENTTAGPADDPAVVVTTKANYQRFAERARAALKVAA